MAPLLAILDARRTLAGFCFCPASRWIARRRCFIGLLVAAVAVADVLLGGAEPLRLLGEDAFGLGLLPWCLALAGAGVRLWAAGNLRKNREVTRSGIYRMVRHPLYMGNCFLYLSILLALGDPILGIGLFLVLLYLVHYPVMFQEEARLTGEYPEQAEAWRGTLRLVPNVFALPQAIATARFTFRLALRNHGLSGFWGVALLPVITESLTFLRNLG